MLHQENDKAIEKMKVYRWLSKSAAETKKAAGKLSLHLQPGDVICLQGDLGSGKTTFVKGLTKGLKIDPALVSSPTFVLMNIYAGRLEVYHFDLYRLDDPRQISQIGMEEFLSGRGVSVIEWAEKLGPFTPSEYLGIEFTHKSEEQRAMHFKARGERYGRLLDKMFG